MLLTMMKHGGIWDFLTRVFNCKGPNFERLMISFATVAPPLSYKAMVESIENPFTFFSMLKRKKPFCSFQAAQYTTDVSFQQSYRPIGSMKEAQPRYSEKRNLHVYKYQSSVLSDRLCTTCSDHSRGR